MFFFKRKISKVLGFDVAILTCPGATSKAKLSQKHFFATIQWNSFDTIIFQNIFSNSGGKILVITYRAGSSLLLFVWSKS